MSDSIIEETLKNNDIKIKPQGYSMYPFIVPGRDSVVLTGIENPESLRRGDVVLYRRQEGILVLHRIWKVKKDGLYMVGDNQSDIEGPIKKEQVKALLVSIEKKGKYISSRNLWYRTCSGIWLVLRPLRPVISHNIAGLKRKLLK